MSSEALEMRAAPGDLVMLHWTCMSEEGDILESSRPTNEPTTFEVGAGDIVGNRLFEAFDEAVRGMSVGETLEGSKWDGDLLFSVPRDHQEIQRLEGRYKNQGGVQEGQLVELSNGGMALVVKANEEVVVLDANNMMAGKSMRFEIELIDIVRS